jgi:hypothetical protein
MGSSPFPSGPTRFTYRDVLVVGIAHLADGGLTIDVYFSDFRRGQSNLGVIPFFSKDLRPRPSRFGYLPTLSLFHFDVMDNGSKGNEAYGHGIPGKNIHQFVGRDDCLSHFQILRCQDIPSFSIAVFDERDKSRSIGIVFDCFYNPRNIDFIPLEIDDPVSSFMASPSVADGNPAD